MHNANSVIWNIHAFPPHSQSHWELFFLNKDRITIKYSKNIQHYSSSASMGENISRSFSWCTKERYSTVQICKNITRTMKSNKEKRWRLLVFLQFKLKKWNCFKFLLIISSCIKTWTYFYTILFHFCLSQINHVLTHFSLLYSEKKISELFILDLLFLSP